MKLSIAIPLYNKGKLIARCLDSLLNQDLPVDEYEIIIVDDGSTDSCELIAQEYAKKEDNIRFFAQENSGPSAARNRALKAAKGDYVYFLDADDFMAPNVIGCLINLCELHRLEILEFNTKEIDDAESNHPSFYNDKKCHELEITEPKTGLGFINDFDFRNQAWRYFISRSYLLQCGVLFLEDMRAYEDMIFNANVIVRANKVAKVKLDAHRYVRVAESIVRSNNPKKNTTFINGMVKAVDELELVKNNANRSHDFHQNVVNRFEGKQHAVVFALITRLFKYSMHNRREQNLILDKMQSLACYPIKSKYAGKGSKSLFFKWLVLPVFNNRTLLFCATKINKLIKRA